MGQIWIASDHHLMHEGILRFKNYLGEPMRVFKDVDHMNTHIIDAHNSVVRDNDKVYFLGDIALRDKGIGLVSRMRGIKRLVMGNHDYGQNIKLYIPYFEAIYSSRMLDKILMTHIPVHPLSFGKALVNVHGHVHSNVPPDHFGKQYYNVSVEMLHDYTPISFEDLKKKAFKRLEQ